MSFLCSQSRLYTFYKLAIRLPIVTGRKLLRVGDEARTFRSARSREIGRTVSAAIFSAEA